VEFPSALDYALNKKDFKTPTDKNNMVRQLPYSKEIIKGWMVCFYITNLQYFLIGF
jgi:hypothetical protein